MSSSNLLRIQCGHCQRRLKAPTHLLGKTLSCPACGTPVEVLDPEDFIEPFTLGEDDAPYGQNGPPLPSATTRPAKTAPVAQSVSPDPVTALPPPDDGKPFNWRRGRQQSRSFWAALVWAIDPMFERYLTPWVIRMTWGILILLTFLTIALSALYHGYVVATPPAETSWEVEQARVELAYLRARLEDSRRQQARPQQGTLRQPRESEREDRFALERQRSFDEQQERLRRQRQAEEEAFEERLRRRTEVPQTPEDLVREAEQRLAEEEANLPSRLGLSMKLIPAQAILFTMKILGSLLSLLWLRVLCEALMVVFNISLKLTRIDESLRASSANATLTNRPASQ